jgi:thiol-disulfide isomerase/thioredoxin
MMMMIITKSLIAIVLLATILGCGNNKTTGEADTAVEKETVQQVDPMQSESAQGEEQAIVHAEFKYEDGQTVNTKDLEGNFWATWCPPCRKEMPSIQVLHEKFKDNDAIEFLIVEIENDIEGTKKFLADQNLNLPIVYPAGDIPSAWLGGAIPTTIILDKQGKTAAKQEGMYDFASQSVEDFVRNLINE